VSRRVLPVGTADWALEVSIHSSSTKLFYIRVAK